MIYFVSTQGKDSYPGTEAKPWRTLRKGFTSLRPGDTLFIRGGRYSERLGGVSPIAIRPGLLGEGITVDSYNGETVVLEGLLWLNRPSYWNIRHLNVTWRRDGKPTEHMVKFTDGVEWSFSHAEVWDAKSFANILVYSSRAGEPYRWGITHCHIHHAHAVNGVNQDHLIYVNSGMHDNYAEIGWCKMHDAPNGNAVKLMGSNESQGVYGVTVVHNTMTRLMQGILVGGVSKGNRIEDNIITEIAGTNPCIRPYKLSGDGNVASNNVWYGAKQFQWSTGGEKRVVEIGNRYLDPELDGELCPQNEEAADCGACA